MAPGLAFAGPPAITLAENHIARLRASLARGEAILNPKATPLPQLPIAGVTPQSATPIDAYTNGATTTLNISSATVIKAAPGRLVRITVIVAGSTAGSANDCITTGAAAAANEVAVVPATIGPVWLDWPMLSGIVVTPGSGQTIAVAYY